MLGPCCIEYLKENTRMHLTWKCIIYKESLTLTLIAAIGYKCLTDVGLLNGQKRKTVSAQVLTVCATAAVICMRVVFLLSEGTLFPP